MNRTAAVDLGANRSRKTGHLHGQAVGGGRIVVDTYTAGNTTARRFLADGDDGRLVRCDAARAPYDDGLFAVEPVDGTRHAQGDLVAVAVEEIGWVQRGVECRDGGWVTHYEADGSGNVSDLGAILATALTGAEVERTGLSARDLEPPSVDATLLVAPDGVVRALSIDVAGTTDEGERATLTLAVSVDAVGSTTVEQPTWYGEATDDLDG